MVAASNRIITITWMVSSRDSFSDLGVSRSADDSLSSHCSMIVNKANKLSEAIRRVFHNSDRRLLRSAFQMYVLPGLMYCIQFWNANMISDIKSIEAVQRRFPKKICNIRHLLHNSRLKELGLLSLENRRRFADMVFAYRYLHGQLGITAPQVGLFTVSSNTRSDDIRLQQQRVSTKKCQAHFSVRVPSQWNKLPCHITSCKSFFNFKRLLFNHLMSFQGGQ